MANTFSPVCAVPGGSPFNARARSETVSRPASRATSLVPAPRRRAQISNASRFRARGFRALQVRDIREGGDGAADFSRVVERGSALARTTLVWPSTNRSSSSSAKIAHFRRWLSELATPRRQAAVILKHFKVFRCTAQREPTWRVPFAPQEDARDRRSPDYRSSQCSWHLSR